jgi:hypothetical protein
MKFMYNAPRKRRFMATWKQLLNVDKNQLLSLAVASPPLRYNLVEVLSTMTPNISASVPVSEATDLRARLIAVFGTMDEYSGAWQAFLDAHDLFDNRSEPSQRFADKVRSLGLLQKSDRPKTHPFLRRIHFRIGRGRELARIREVVKASLVAETADVGVVLFQGDEELDWTVDFLSRLEKELIDPLRDDPPDRPTLWANWDYGTHIELTNTPYESRYDLEGKMRAGWCVSEVEQRLRDAHPRSLSRTSGDAIEQLRALLGKLEYARYVLVHTIDASDELDGVDTYLSRYLSSWMNELKEAENSLGTPLRFLLLIHLKIDPNVQSAVVKANQAGIKKAIREVVPELETDDDIPIYGSTQKPIDHLQCLYDIRRQEFKTWLSEYDDWIRGAHRYGLLATGQMNTLIQLGRDAMVGLFEPETPVRLGQVEGVLRKLVEHLEAALNEAA